MSGRGPALLLLLLLGGCAAGSLGYGQGGRSEDGRSYEEARADNRIAAAVNRRLVRAPGLRATDIHVACRNGVITLTGRVATSEAAHRAAQLARDVAGVRGVNNALRYGPEP